MSEVQVRIGYARKIEVGLTGTFAQQCKWIRQNYFFHDWQWIDQHDSRFYLEWESEDKKNSIQYINKTGEFYLITFVEYNDNLYASVMIALNEKTKEDFLFSFVYYDGGTCFNESFEREILNMEKENKLCGGISQYQKLT